MFLRGVGLVALAAAMGASAHAAPTLTDLTPVPVHQGVNPVPRLAPDGRDGIIIEAAHNDSPIADGSSVDILVLLRQTPRGSAWETVDTVQTPSLVSDLPFGGRLISAAPHTGEDWRLSIDFARAKVDGVPAFLMVVGERDMRRADNAYTPVPVDLLIYRLTPDPDVGQDHFVLIERRAAKGCYVDVRLAVRDSLGLPLPAGYEGPRAESPCGPSRP
jgi:hypothetical protein